MEKQSIYDLIYEREIYDELVQEVENLEGAQKNIQTLFGILQQEKDAFFIELGKYKIHDLFNVIFKFANYNKAFFNQNKELEIQIFLDFFSILR